MELATAIDLFVSRPEIAPATRKTYRFDLASLCGFLGPQRPLDAIIAADVLRYVQHLNRRATIHSAVTYNKHIKSINAFFNFCVRIGELAASPSAVLRRKAVSERVPKSKAMPDSDLIKLLEYVCETVRGWQPREEALVRFLADTGCRIGSAADLTEERLDVRERSARLTTKGKPELHEVRFGRECAHALSAWLLRRKVTSAGRYVFSSDGHRMTNVSLGQYFSRICERSGIGRWGPHSLRHRFGHKASEKFPPSVGARMLGDTVEVFLRHYTRFDDDYIQRAMLEMTTDHLIQHNIIQLLEDKNAVSE